MKKELDIKDIKTITTDILYDFDVICNENKIEYSVGYGTMLGAVRHKGFIPWDDDVDVIMTRDNYNKLLKVKSSFEPMYSLMSIDTDKQFTAPLAKIIDNRTELIQKSHAAERVKMGVYIDVFILDTVPKNLRQRKLLYKELFVLQKAWSFCENRPKETDPLILKKIREIFNKTDFARGFSIWMNYIAKRKRNSEVYSNLMYSVYNRSKEEIGIDNICHLREYNFENIKVSGVENADSYLKNLYGDYMNLPPVEQRVTHHNYVAYYKEQGD